MKKYEGRNIEAKQQFTELIPVNDILNMLIELFETSAINYWGVIHMEKGNALQKGIDETIERLEKENSEITSGELFAELIYGYDYGFRIYDIEASKLTELGTINWVGFYNALKKYAQSKGMSMKSVVENYDSDTIDWVVQYALFDTIVYG
jgi:hypothetical protein